MANSKLPPQNNQPLINSVAQFLACALQSQQAPKLLLALSGGLDSMVLLNLLVACRQNTSFQLSAMHVHHGLSPNADAWAAFCETACEALDVPFELQHVTVDQSLGLGVEAAARQVRYQALQSSNADWICLAHHQNDQAETVLLQLARGAGVKGLSGMALIDEKQHLLRPLLNHTRAELTHYANDCHIEWVEDESNQCLNYDRNVIRQQVLPVLEKQYSAIIANLSRSAMHQAEASTLLTELAEIDAEKVLKVNESNHQVLSLIAFKTLSDIRAKNLLRHWLGLNGVQMPSTVHLVELFRQLSIAQRDTALQVKVAELLSVRTYLNHAYLVSDMPIGHDYQHIWQGEHALIINETIQLRFEEKQGVGLSLAKVKDKGLTIKNRVGGEMLKPEEGRPNKSIKHLFQEAGIPPWLRDNYPFIYVGDLFACMPTIATHIDSQAQADEIGLDISLSYIA